MSCKEIILGLVLVLSFVVSLEGQLQKGFYMQSCNIAEFLIKDEVRRAYFNDRGVAPGLVRLHFHDCFVRGCDGSVLIDSTPSNEAEKDSLPNRNSLRGFEVIDNAKARLEQLCPGVVSCADITAYAARDATEMAGGFGYDVEAGRRDGRISRTLEALQNLPPPLPDVPLLTKIFASKGLTQEEMVILSGAHTIGRSHCANFRNRLYNFSTNSAQDPSLNSFYAAQLKRQCPMSNSNPNTVVPIDVMSPDTFDVAYYRGILANRGLFGSDQVLGMDSATAGLVNLYASNPFIWQQRFGDAMVSMGRAGVLTGDDGEIRSNCRVPN